MKEIEEECGKLPATGAVPQRLLRSQQKKKVSAPVSAVGQAEDQEEVDGGEESVGGKGISAIISLVCRFACTLFMQKCVYCSMEHPRTYVRTC